ncbi:PTS glucose transporter subunit IIBC [soil metagenome]
MTVWRNAFGWLQKIGKSLMLPVSVLPVAGILLGVGSAEFTWLPAIVSAVMAQSGGAIFGNLPVIFAIGVALGFTGNDGVAALAAVVGYVVLLATMGVVAVPLGYEPKTIMGIPTIETGVFGGILIGAIAGWLFNRYFRLQLPPYLGFFSGKRSVPILAALAAVVAGLLLSLVWPPVGRGIDGFSRWAASGNPAAAFAIYGIVERALIPFGLHHIWNVPFFFEVGQYLDPGSGKILRGEIYRYTAGDPTAGNLAGGYLFKMWGLPAAAIAIWRSARPEHRAKVGGIMISAALTSFLTGITEPIEFSFLFVAPLLYGIHAVLAAVAYYVCIELGVKHGMTFSHGLIDFIVLFQQSTHALWFLWLGPIWAAMYYGIFTLMIRHRDLKTPGRELEETVETGTPRADTGQTSLPRDIVLAFGGRSNIQSLDACITRLRVELRDVTLARPDRLKALGASGVMTMGRGIQAIFGTRSENLKTDIEAYLKTGADAEGPADSAPSVGAPRSPASPVAVRATTPRPDIAGHAAGIGRALGGLHNLQQVDLVAITRLRIVVANADAIDVAALQALGGPALMRIGPNLVHVIVGPNAAAVADALRERISDQRHSAGPD